MKKINNLINESSLSRLWKNNLDHDCAALTAYRDAKDCGSGEKYIHKDNAKRNLSLKSKLMNYSYGITNIRGKYPEGGVTKKENSFFVVNINDDPNFFKNIVKLGEEFEQDSILYIPKGSIEGKSKAFLYGTNKCKNNWLGYHKKEVFNKGKLGYDSKIYTSYINNRPFVFEDIGSPSTNPASGMGKWMMRIISNKKWYDIDLDNIK